MGKSCYSTIWFLLSCCFSGVHSAFCSSLLTLSFDFSRISFSLSLYFCLLYGRGLVVVIVVIFVWPRRHWRRRRAGRRRRSHRAGWLEEISDILGVSLVLKCFGNFDFGCFFSCFGWTFFDAVDVPLALSSTRDYGYLMVQLLNSGLTFVACICSRSCLRF